MERVVGDPAIRVRPEIGGVPFPVDRRDPPGAAHAVRGRGEPPSASAATGSVET